MFKKLTILPCICLCLLLLGAAGAGNLQAQERVVSPAAGPQSIYFAANRDTGSSANFRFGFVHPDGAALISWIRIVFGDSKDDNETMFISVQLEDEKIRLGTMGRFGGPYQEGIAGEARTLSSEHVNIDLSQVEIIHTSSTSLELRINLNFAGKDFSGIKHAFVQVEDIQLEGTEYEDQGVFNITQVAGTHKPKVIRSRSENSEGRGGDFVFVVEDEDGADDIKEIKIRISTDPDRWFDTMTITVWPALNTYRLVTQDNQFFDDTTIGRNSSTPSAAVRSNALLIDRLGKQLTFRANLKFNPRMIGHYKVYMYVKDFSGRTDGWKETSQYTVRKGASIPRGLYMIPGDVTVNYRVVGREQPPLHVYAVWSDLDGVDDIKMMEIKWAESVGHVTNIVNVRIVPSMNAAYLYGAEQHPFFEVGAIGSTVILDNAFARIPLNTMTVTNLGTSQVAVEFDIQFKNEFIGDWNAYMRGIDFGDNQSAWRRKGTLTVRDSNSKPRARSVRPFFTTNTLENYVFEFTDADGPNDIVTAEILFNEGAGRNPDTEGGLHIIYDNRTRTVTVEDENVSYSSPLSNTTLTPGTNRGRLFLNRTWVLLEGDKLKFITRLEFFPAEFSGAKSIWLRATDVRGRTSGWRLLGGINLPEE